MENKVAGSYDRNHYGTTLSKNLLHPGGIPDENIFNLSFTVRTSIESVDQRKTALKISQNKNQSRPPVTCLRYGTIVLLSLLLAFFVL